MHAGFPCLSRDINRILRLGAKEGKVEGLLERVGGKFVATGMATLIELGLCFVMRCSPFHRDRAAKSEEFFRENFEIWDQDAPFGIRYYQGKILIRTDQPEDDMNVYVRFCPDPEALFRKGFLGWLQLKLLGTTLNTSAIVSAEVLNEKEAEELQRDPEKVDLVISFRDALTIAGLIDRPDVDAGELLIGNVVRMKGNVGHLFKFGAIAKNAELALGLG